MKRGPLLSWDIYSEYTYNLLKSLRKSKEAEFLSKFHDKFGWDFEIEETLFKNEYKAIVVTDKHQKIIWVNDGFKEMTGYSFSHVKNKNPKMLQGEKTSKKTLKYIKKNLLKNAVCETSMVNYRKDGSEYICKLKIIPITNTSKKIEHYIALESEVSSA